METIKSNEKISKLFSSGKRFSNKYATFIVSNESLKRCTPDEHDRKGRVAFIAGKKHGNAVWRNSAKRRMREIFRANYQTLGHLEILFIAKPTIMDESYSKVLNACEDTFKRITHG